METKKTKKAQIEGLRGTWLLMGVITVLSFMFVSFEWAQRDIEISPLAQANDPLFEITMVPITFPEQEPPPPPPAPPALADEINVVDNESELEETGVRSLEESKEPVIIITIPLPDEPEIFPIETEIRDFAEIMPSFPGGTAALNAYLSKNIKYPPAAQEQGAHGKVIIQFVVDTDGKITNPVIVRTSPHPHLDREALRVIESMPKWEPGKQGGKPVRVKFTVPVNFRLQK